MEEQLKEKKIRWNISKAMSAVYQSLNDSKLRIKKTKAYSAAMDNLKTLYNLNQTQIWILCLACERYFECEDSITFKNISSELDVPVMSIISWKKEIEFLIEHGFLEHSGRNGAVQPINDFSESIYNNTEYIPQAKKEDDDIDFISYMADCYESRRGEDMSARSIQRELRLYERAHSHLEVVKRVSAELENPNNRFFVYDVASDVLKGEDSYLNATISDLYDGGERYNVATEMMEEKHELFQKGLVEFVKKGNLSDATITLSDKGRKLVLGEKAFLFEDSINDKNLIKQTASKKRSFSTALKIRRKLTASRKPFRKKNSKVSSSVLKTTGFL